MNIRTNRRSPRSAAVRLLGISFLSVGVAIVVLCGYVFWGSNVAGDQAAAQILERASQQMEQPEAREPAQALASSNQTSSAPAPSSATPEAQGSTIESPSARAEASTPRSPKATTPRPPTAESDLTPGDILGVVSIPSIDLRLPVLEGIDGGVLDQGVLGHYPGTGIPGSIGNFAIAGHRTTHGAPLYDIDQIAVGDPIVVQTPQGWDVYVMDRQRIVDPAAVEVLAPVPDDPQASPTEASMVLTSCHPKLSAEKRMVVYASLDRHVPKDRGPPEELG